MIFARATFLRVLSLAALCGTLCGCASVTPPSPAKPAGSAALALETFDEVWRIVYETHFDTNYNGHNWIAVKQKYRPRVAAAQTQREVRDAIDEMLDLLQVSHLALVPGELTDPEDQSSGGTPSVEKADDEDRGSAGMEIRYSGLNLVVTRVESGSPAAEVGIKPGWILRAIGPEQTAAIKQKFPESLDERRRNFLAWRRASRLLAGAPGSEIDLEFITGNDQQRVRILRRAFPRGEAIQFGSLPVLYAHLLSTNLTQGGKSIGMIRFNIWMLPTALAFHRALDQHRSRDGIIIDLRGNVGGVVGMIIGVAGHFVTESITLGTLLARDNTLKLPANPRFADATGKRVEPYGGPVAVLVDEITASASEVFAGGLQEHGRVRIFGRTTAGQALPAVYEALPNGDMLYHPIADFLTPKGKRFEARGVVPDVEIPLDRAALLQGRDPVIEAASAWIAAQAK